MKRLLACLAFSLATSVYAAEDIVVADFTKGAWPEGWVVEGTAFGAPLPTATSRDRTPPTDNHRQFWNGSMSSPEFAIERDFINIKVCGTKNPGQTYVSLFVEGREVRRLTDMDMNFKHWRTIDTKDLKGRKGKLEVQDKYNYGWVDIDLIELSDSTKHNQVVSTVPVWEKTAFETTIGKEKYLLLPVAGNAPTQDVTIEIDGKEIFTFPFSLSQENAKDFLPRSITP